uniref:hypothetical protein n=1 Tax=Komagataeibacter europaeus TaxID=33995 RepID=UPI0038CDBE0B
AYQARKTVRTDGTTSGGKRCPEAMRYMAVMETRTVKQITQRVFTHDLSGATRIGKQMRPSPAKWPERHRELQAS